METVEAVSESAGVCGTPGSAPRTTATATAAGLPATATPAPRTINPAPHAAIPASHATTQFWPTSQCGSVPEASAFPAAPRGPELLGPEQPGTELLGPELLGPELLGPELLGPEPLDLVTVPARQGLEAVDILRRASAATCTGAAGSGPSAVGPVLHDGPCVTVGFLVPPGTADGWDMPGSACTQTLGRGVSFDIPGQGAAGGADGSAASASTSASPSLPAYAGEPAVPRVPEPPVTGTGWLLPPTDDTVPVTDPAALRRALGEAARLIEAADRCR